MRKLACLGVSLLLVFSVAGCSTGGGGSSGIEGTWVNGTSTMVITASTVSGSDPSLGTVTMKIDNNDTAAGHMQATVTAATGFFAVFTPPGTVDYVTYRLYGNTLYYDGDTSGYPASATTAYTRQ